MSNLAQFPGRPWTQTRVMIVEDEANIAYPMAELLEDLGCATLVVEHGDEARERASEFKPEIVLLDIDLPGLNGYGVAQALRETPELASLLIIAITGHNEPEDKQKAYGVGMDLHLAKPLPINFFKELILSFGKTLRRFAAASL